MKLKLTLLHPFLRKIAPIISKNVPLSKLLKPEVRVTKLDVQGLRAQWWKQQFSRAETPSFLSTLRQACSSVSDFRFGVILACSTVTPYSSHCKISVWQGNHVARCKFSRLNGKSKGFGVFPVHSAERVDERTAHFPMSPLLLSNSSCHICRANLRQKQLLDKTQWFLSTLVGDV